MLPFWELSPEPELEGQKKPTMQAVPAGPQPTDINREAPKAQAIPTFFEVEIHILKGSDSVSPLSMCRLGHGPL